MAWNRLYQRPPLHCSAAAWQLSLRCALGVSSLRPPGYMPFLKETNPICSGGVYPWTPGDPNGHLGYRFFTSSVPVWWAWGELRSSRGGGSGGGRSPHLHQSPRPTLASSHNNLRMPRLRAAAARGLLTVLEKELSHAIECAARGANLPMSGPALGI